MASAALGGTDPASTVRERRTVKPSRKFDLTDNTLSAYFGKTLSVMRRGREGDESGVDGLSDGVSSNDEATAVRVGARAFLRYRLSVQKNVHKFAKPERQRKRKADISSNDSGSHDDSEDSAPAVSFFSC